jgi:hypothetical protein
MNKNIVDLYRNINDFKKVYQRRTNSVKVGKGDLVADPPKILLGAEIIIFSC